MGGIMANKIKRWKEAGVKLARSPRLFDGILELAERVEPGNADDSEIDPAVEIVLEALEERGHHDLAKEVAAATDPAPEERAEAARQIAESVQRHGGGIVAAARIELGRIVRELEHVRDDLGRAEGGQHGEES